MSLEHYLSAFEAFARERSDDPLLGRRREALDAFARLGFPTTKLEDWRFTNLGPLAGSRFETARPTTNTLGEGEVARLGLGPGLVFVDGHYRPDLSAPPEGVEVRPLREALADADVRERFGSLADIEQQPFVALNAAFAGDGAFLHVTRRARIEAPVHLLFVGTGKAAHPRNLYLLEEGAAAHVVETWASLGSAGHWSNPVHEVILAPDAALEHTRLQCENDATYHTSNVHIHQERDSRYTSHLMTLGGALTRNDITAALDGEGIVCTLNGLFLTRGAQHVDNHTRILHRKPHAESHELYKGILDERSSGVFTGYIHVLPDAQKTDAYQSSSSLLLSDEAVMDSKPQLEIYADDVKCSHGSTIGQLDADALFYLRARGIPRGQATNMLIRAFAHDVIDRIEVEAARDRLDELLEARLPGDAAGG